MLEEQRLCKLDKLDANSIFLKKIKLLLYSLKRRILVIERIAKSYFYKPVHMKKLPRTSMNRDSILNSLSFGFLQCKKIHGEIKKKFIVQ